MMTPSDKSYRLIPLSQGRFAAVDLEDFERVSRLKWCAWVKYRADGTIQNIYATHSTHPGGLRLHRFILGITDPKILVDHRNHLGLDCRKKNLRVACNTTNAANARLRRDNKSGFKGVKWHKKDQKWHVCIGSKPRTFIASVDDAEEGARLYDEAAISRYGEFAHLNFPPS